MNVRNHVFNRFFMGFTMNIKFAPIFTMIFTINTSKYVCIRSFKENGGLGFSEAHWIFLSASNLISEIFNLIFHST